MSFKLLAIRPMPGTDPKFLKNLKPGVIYKFYQEYGFYADDEKKIRIDELPFEEQKKHVVKTVERISHEVPENLYSQEGGPSINISAVVGKNGSGKSSLVELLYLYFYNVGCHFETLKKHVEIDQANIVNKEITNGNIPIYKEVICKAEKVRIQIFYIKGNDFFISICSNTEIELLKNGKNVDSFKEHEENLCELFYNIAINFSLHGLNSKFTNKWLEEIFPKSDNYITPIVLEPYRKDGIINVNRNNEFAMQRTIANLLIENKIKNNERYDLQNPLYLITNTVVSSMSFTYKYQLKNIGKNYFEGIENEIYIKVFESSNFNNDNDKITNDIKDYLIYKLNKILEENEFYNKRYINPSPLVGFQQNQLNNFLDEILNDKSHVTYKIKQVLHFFFNKEILGQSKNFSLTLLELHQYVKGKKDNCDDVFNNLLPFAFFDVEIKLKNIDSSDDKEYSFSSLSSGEQQMIQVINTITYHLNNINSKKNVFYESIQVIFDEIELYFHPEYQQKFINHLVNSMKIINYKNEENSLIKNINFIFLTHSPFILSDIPSHNILRIKDGKPVKAKNDTNSFAANIHDLLADEFFLEDGFMGEFAKGKIQYLLNSKKKITENDMKVVELIGDQFLKSVLKDKLLSKVKNQELLDREIEKREKELRELKAKRNASN